MQQSDYILREIEKISHMLMGMLGKMILRQKQGIELNENEYSSMLTEFNEDASLDIESILQSDKDQFESIFRTFHGFDAKNLEILADLFAAMAEVDRDERQRLFYSKAYELYEYINVSTKSISIDRMAKMEQIEVHLH